MVGFSLSKLSLSKSRGHEAGDPKAVDDADAFGKTIPQLPPEIHFRIVENAGPEERKNLSLTSNFLHGAVKQQRALERYQKIRAEMAEMDEWAATGRLDPKHADVGEAFGKFAGVNAFDPKPIDDLIAKMPEMTEYQRYHAIASATEIWSDYTKAQQDTMFSHMKDLQPDLRWQALAAMGEHPDCLTTHLDGWTQEVFKLEERYRVLVLEDTLKPREAGVKKSTEVMKLPVGLYEELYENAKTMQPAFKEIVLRLLESARTSFQESELIPSWQKKLGLG